MYPFSILTKVTFFQKKSGGGGEAGNILYMNLGPWISFGVYKGWDNLRWRKHFFF